MPIITALIMSLLSPPLALATIAIRFAIEVARRRRNDPLRVTYKHSTRRSRRRFAELLEESKFAVVNRGVTVL